MANLVREFSPLLSLTAGLGALHARASAAHAAESGSYSSTGSMLVLSHRMPLLARRYRFLHKIGEGTFAQLICAEDTLKAGMHRQVAIKIMHRPFWSIGVREAKLLGDLHASHEEGGNGELQTILRLFATFNFMGHYCLVFELLNAAPLALPRSSVPSPALAPTHMLNILRKISFQIMSSLLFLGKQGILHADLKPQNILLVNKPDVTGRQSYTIKFIDFGNALYLHEASVYHDDFELQSLLYRAPEVLVGLPFGLPIDVWSVGCIIAELCLGRPLFEAHSREQMLVLVQRFRGGLHPSVFSSGRFWRAAYANEAPWSHSQSLAKLTQTLGVNDPVFISFMDGLLQLDPAARLTPWQALLHPFLRALFPLGQLLACAPIPATPAAAAAAVPVLDVIPKEEKEQPIEPVAQMSPQSLQPTVLLKIEEAVGGAPEQPQQQDVLPPPPVRKIAMSQSPPKGSPPKRRRGDNGRIVVEIKKEQQLEDSPPPMLAQVVIFSKPPQSIPAPQPRRPHEILIINDDDDEKSGSDDDDDDDELFYSPKPLEVKSPPPPPTPKRPLESSHSSSPRRGGRLSSPIKSPRQLQHKALQKRVSSPFKRFSSPQEPDEDEDELLLL